MVILVFIDIIPLRLYEQSFYTDPAARVLDLQHLQLLEKKPFPPGADGVQWFYVQHALMGQRVKSVYIFF